MKKEKYFSQIGQDQYFIENISKGKHNGFYIDIGANDGKFCSNTATLEYSFNWTGLCIEANPNLIPTLKENRPNSTIIHKAIWKESGTVDLEIPLKFKDDIPGDQLGRISNIPELNNRNSKYFKKEFANETQKFTVPSDTVTNVVRESVGLPIVVDYLSLDTEGAELEALQSIDFDVIDIKFMTIEHGNRKGYAKIFTDYLQPFGFKVHRLNKWDIEFEKDE